MPELRRLQAPARLPGDEAEAIVSGEQDLLALDPLHRVRILNPTDFCAWP